MSTRAERIDAARETIERTKAALDLDDATILSIVAQRAKKDLVGTGLRFQWSDGSSVLIQDSIVEWETRS